MNMLVISRSNLDKANKNLIGQFNGLYPEGHYQHENCQNVLNIYKEQTGIMSTYGDQIKQM